MKKKTSLIVIMLKCMCIIEHVVCIGGVYYVDMIATECTDINQSINQLNCQK